jgi:hypothetical protein
MPFLMTEGSLCSGEPIPTEIKPVPAYVLHASVDVGLKNSIFYVLDLLACYHFIWKTIHCHCPRLLIHDIPHT